MLSIDEIGRLYRVPKDGKFRLADFHTSFERDATLPKAEQRSAAEAALLADRAALADAQELLYADNRWSVLVILQAMDAAGKDSTIKHVLSGVNPQGCQVYSFKQPSAEELDHTYLWRCMKVLPERGKIGVFNRSYYEEVLTVRVHPEFLKAQRIPNVPAGETLWQDRYDDINAFERHLERNGTRVLKFFLHVSKSEQRRRFLRRLNKPEKNWKFMLSDVVERGFWDQYMEAYEHMLAATSTPWAPWYVIPADQKWASRFLVARILETAIRSLDLHYPQQSQLTHQQLEEARRKLEAEGE